MNKWLVVVESNTTGTGMLALRKAQAPDLSSMFFTNDPQRYKDLEATGCPVVVCDTNSIESLKDAIDAQLASKQIQGITTTSEFYLELVAQLATIYNLPTNTPHAVNTCRNKARTRLQLAHAHIRQPDFAIIHSQEEIDKAVEKLGLPCVVKPADDTGSYAVLLCQTKEEIDAQVQYILRARTNVRGQQTAQTALIEEFLDAPEYSVETFTWRGETRCIGITEKSLWGRPYFVEYRHIFPAFLSWHATKEIERTVCRTLGAIGITHGAAHTEVKLTPHGCAIIEVNARLAGGMIPELIRYAKGIDILEQQIKAALGQEPSLHTDSARYAGIQFLVSSVEGKLVDVQGVELVRQIPGVESVTITRTSGSQVSLPRSAYDRLGYIIVQAQTYEDVISKLGQAAMKLEVHLLPQTHMVGQEEKRKYDRTA